MKLGPGLKAFVLGFSALLLAMVPSIGLGQSFSVSASPASLTIHPGDQNVPLTVSVVGSSSYSGPVTVTLTGLPSGIAVTPVTINTGNSGTLSLSASISADQEAFPANAAGESDSATSTVTLVGAAGSTIATSSLTLIVSLENPAYAPPLNQINLPIVTINTNGVPIVDKTTDVPGTITITSADGQTSYLPNSSDNDNMATFHLHGHSTILMPKKPYHISLNTSLDLLNTMGLSCPYVTSGKAKPTCDKSKSYILLANYDDKTFLRDWVASALANAIPIGNGYLDSPADSPSPSGTSTLMPWAPHSLFVELYLNGAYQGNYQLIEEVKVDSHRVNINELSDTDTSNVTGGYLLEIDEYQDEDFVFRTPQNFPIGLIDPDFTPEVPEQTSYISNYVDTAETALFSSNFTDPTLGWRAYFDEASAINFYIVNDLMGNVDGGDFYSSDYFYKDENNPLLYMGPIWDFDISSGNVNYVAVVSPTVPWMQIEAPWYTQWFRDPGFKADVIQQWNALKNNGVFTAWLASINQEAATLQQSQANNFGRWPMQGVRVWPNPEASGSYDGEVAYLTNWIDLRIAYLDSQFNGRAQTATAISMPSSTMRSGVPFTLSAVVSGGKTPTGTVSFLANGVVVGTGALGAGGNASATITNMPTATESLTAVYSGDGNNSLSSSSPVTVTVLAPFIGTVTSISGPVSSIATGMPANFSVSVLGNSGSQPPAGTVSFTANGAAAGTATLSGTGTAAFTTSALPAGSVSVQAAYSGDNNYQGSTSNVVTVSMLPIGYTLALNPSSITLDQGQIANATLTLTPVNGYSGAVTLSCANLPANLSCTFTQSGASSANINVNGPTSIGVAIHTDVAQADLKPRGTNPLLPAIALWCPVGLAAFGRKRRRHGKRSCFLLSMLLAVLAVGGFSGCSNGPLTPPGAFTVAITATPAQGSATVASQTVNLALTIRK